MSMFITPIQLTNLQTLNSDTEQSLSNSLQIPFQDVLNQAVKEVNIASEDTKQDSFDLAFGDVNNLAQLQINSLKTQAMLQTTVQLTTRAVNAYKEIMQMQI